MHSSQFFDACLQRCGSSSPQPCQHEGDGPSSHQARCHVQIQSRPLDGLPFYRYSKGTRAHTYTRAAWTVGQAARHLCLSGLSAHHCINIGQTIMFSGQVFLPQNSVSPELGAKPRLVCSVFWGCRSKPALFLLMCGMCAGRSTMHICMVQGPQ